MTTETARTYGITGAQYAIYPAGTGPVSGLLDGRPYRAVRRGSKADDGSGLIGYARGLTAAGALHVWARANGALWQRIDP